MFKYSMFATALLVSSISMASAFDSIKDQTLQAEAYNMLLQNSDGIKLTGDVRPTEKLSDLLAVSESYFRELEETILSGGDIENMKTYVKSVDTACTRNESLTKATCVTSIALKPLGETAITYTVDIDKDDAVVGISSTALVDKGD